MTTLPCKKSQVVFITWSDAMQSVSHGDAEEVMKLQLAVNTNIGWIVHEDPTRIVLANGISSSGEIDYILIPVANILERRKV